MPSYAAPPTLDSVPSLMTDSRLNTPEYPIKWPYSLLVSWMNWTNSSPLDEKNQNVKTTFTVSSLVFKSITQAEEALNNPWKAEWKGIKWKSFSAVCQPEVPTKAPALSHPLHKLSNQPEENERWEKEKAWEHHLPFRGSWEQEVRDVAQGDGWG